MCAFVAYALHQPLSELMEMDAETLVHWTEAANALMKKVYKS
jgi:hypothetical protein